MPDSHAAHDHAERIRRQKPHYPQLAFSSLTHLTCHETRCKLAILVAQSWARQDINAAWNAVSRSSLNATKKQLMFNELWG